MVAFAVPVAIAVAVAEVPAAAVSSPPVGIGPVSSLAALDPAPVGPVSALRSAKLAFELAESAPFRALFFSGRESCLPFALPSKRAAARDVCELPITSLCCRLEQLGQLGRR